jgi:hypothetical protein
VAIILSLLRRGPKASYPLGNLCFFPVLKLAVSEGDQSLPPTAQAKNPCLLIQLHIVVNNYAQRQLFFLTLLNKNCLCGEQFISVYTSIKNLKKLMILI